MFQLKPCSRFHQSVKQTALRRSQREVGKLMSGGCWFSCFVERVMSALQDTPADESGRSVSSHLEAARRTELRSQERGRPESKTDDCCDSIRSIDTDVATPNSARSLRAEVRHLKAELAEEQQNNERTQAQLKVQICETRARVVQTNKQIQETTERFVHEQSQRAHDGAALRRANVLLKGKTQEMTDLVAQRDRLQGIINDRNAARLLAGGIIIQPACPTLPEVEANIRRALSVTVSEWIEELPAGVVAQVWFPWMVSRVFLECRELVGGIAHEHAVFMDGGVGRKGEASTMDEATVDVFRQHIRRHHRTLFPLTGEHLQRSCTEVASKLGHWLEPILPGWSRDRIAQELMKIKLDRVVAAYLPILVGAKLQHPVVAFSDDCGMVKWFNAAIHAESVGGDAVNNGQACLVVFPALMVERESGGGFQPLSKPYILPVVGNNR